MSTEPQPRGKLRVFWLPVLAAIPVIAGVLFLALRYGPTLLKLLGILIKMAVKA